MANDLSGPAAMSPDPRPVHLGEEVTIATAACGNAAVTALCLEALFRSTTGRDHAPPGDYSRFLI